MPFDKSHCKHKAISMSLIFPPLNLSSKASKNLMMGCFIGSALEWFDFAIYGYLASVLGQLFFPNLDPYAALLRKIWDFFAAIGLSGFISHQFKLLLWPPVKFYSANLGKALFEGTVPLFCWAMIYLGKKLIPIEFEDQKYILDYRIHTLQKFSRPESSLEYLKPKKF